MKIIKNRFRKFFCQGLVLIISASKIFSCKNETISSSQEFIGLKKMVM